MANIKTQCCDECRVQRKEEAKRSWWWKVFFFARPTDENKPCALLILPWDVNVLSDFTDRDFQPEHADRHFCGEGCLFKWLQTRVTEGTIITSGLPRQRLPNHDP